MSAESVALEHYRRRRRLVRAVEAAVRRAWAQITLADLDRSWLKVADPLLVAVSGAQLAAAATAETYLGEVLAQQGLSAAAEGRLASHLLAGVASDGRPLASLLQRSIVTVKTAIDAGVPAGRAMASGYARLNIAAATQVADAGRVADQVALTARRNVGGYTRMLVGGSCSRCVILAGKWYRWNTGFNRHPKCFPAGVVVDGPAALAATRRRYQGELVIVRTAGGQELPTTGNHPVLTDRGWLPANLLQEGDHVVRSTSGQGAAALVVPHEDQVPARIEDCWRADGVVPLHHVPTTAEDFHGDGGHGDVDVVLADGLLRHGLQAAGGELAEQEQLARRIAQALGLAGQGAAGELLEGLLGAAHLLVGGRRLGEAFGGRHPAGTYAARGGHVADRHAGVFESAADDVAGHTVAAAEAVLALAGAVGLDDLVDRQDVFSARWDAPAGPFTVQSRAAYAAAGQDLLLRLAGQVALDRVVEVRRVEWSGHVYNLTSSEGWYSANKIIVSNCDCIHVPTAENRSGDLRTDPKLYFAGLSRSEQDRTFTKAGAEAIRAGGDPAQVVNARRGMYVAGEQQMTTTGATRRGLAGGRLGAGRGRRAARLMPEQIFREAGGDRDEAIRLLRVHGYIL